jgi:hypothetical protein
MALQSSGAISISQIKAELGSSSYSLRTLSSEAGKSTPDAMSEFYGYSAAVTVNIDAYVPSSVGCYNTYTFSAVSSQAVNTNVNVGFNWYGDLGGYIVGSVNIISGTTCRSGNVDSGGVNCMGEYLTNIYWSPFPTSNGNQNFFPNTYYTDIVPC